MTPTELKALFVVLVVTIGVCVWILVARIRYEIRMGKFRQEEQEHRQQEQGLPLQRIETWTWPDPQAYQPGEWAGPSKRLLRFLHQLNGPGWQPELKFYAYIRAQEHRRRNGQWV